MRLPSPVHFIRYSGQEVPGAKLFFVHVDKVGNGINVPISCSVHCFLFSFMVLLLVAETTLPALQNSSAR